MNLPRRNTFIVDMPLKIPRDNCCNLSYFSANYFVDLLKYYKNIEY